MKSLMGNPVNGDQSMVVLGLCAFWGNTDGGDYVTDMCQIRVNSVALCIIASHNACLMPLTVLCLEGSCLQIQQGRTGILFLITRL